MICYNYTFYMTGTIASLVTTIKSKAKENHCAGILVFYDIAEHRQEAFLF